MSGRSLRMFSTIGPVEAGLIPALEQAYLSETGISIVRSAMGSGAALERAKGGGADVLITHAPELVRAFINEGWGLSRTPFAANRFAIAGPATDPAGIRGLASARLALQRIAAARANFLTRGDRSGTHVKELQLWASAGIQPAGEPWYLTSSMGELGNGATAADAAQLSAYTLLDEATLITGKLALEALVTDDPMLLNVFSVVIVNPERVPQAFGSAAQRFADWLLEPTAQDLIGVFGWAEHGRPLFLNRAGLPQEVLRS